jgi:hypothetical protein
MSNIFPSKSTPDVIKKRESLSKCVSPYMPSPGHKENY